MSSKAAGLRIRLRPNASVKERTLIRVVAETLKKIVHLYQVKTTEEILTSFEIQSLRYKLKECLSRLMFLEPLEFGQKAEDTIWKSIFYEPIRLFKKELKNAPGLINSKSMLLAGFKRHILGAIGYYQKLIMRLQTDYGFIEANYPNFSGVFGADVSELDKDISSELKSWAFSCIQHCLLYIGDLYRYEHDIKSPHSRSLAIRYYNLVSELNPSLGHAYNQLATLDTLSYYGLNAAYYYLKAQLSVYSFVQAKDNLVILFERNVKRLRSVIDRELLMKKSGCNMSRSSLKVFRVKSSITKYLNLWYSFSTSSDIDNHDAKQLAIMCDDVLNNLSFVLGFDRKLVSDSSSSTGIRPSTLNSKTVSVILFIANACLKLMVYKNDQDDDNCNQRNVSTFDLAHSLTLNLYGHVFNQCLVRIRDEIRAANIDISVLFHRYENQDNESVSNDDYENFISSDTAATFNQQITSSKTKLTKKKITLSKRLVRTRLDTTDEQHLEDDLSEDDNNLSENYNVLWDDQLSDSSDSDDGKGFGFIESEEETDFESDEEIHSQDEDDQIIRAIVGSSTVFGRQQSCDKEVKRAKSKDTEKVIYGDSILSDPKIKVKKSKRSTIHKDTILSSPYASSSTDILFRSILNIDLLQSLTVFSQSMHILSDNSLISFNRIWNSAPYLWKHFSVLLNFCENLLDDFNLICVNNKDCCSHIQSDVRKTVSSILPEDLELKGSLLDLKDKDAVICDNGLHQVVSRLNRLIKCGLWINSMSNGPLQVQHNNNGNVWLFSFSHNAPRVNLISRSWMQISSNIDIQVNTNTDKEKFMREMARLRLENEISSSSDTEDNKDKKYSQCSNIPDIESSRAIYLIPDVNILCSRMDVIKTILRTKQFIIVIPKSIIQTLDKRKTTDHGARQAIKYLEVEMQQNSEHIKIEEATVSRMPDISCDLISDWPAIETSAVRLAKLATPSSVSGCDIVVTVLSENAINLPTSFTSYYASLRVNFLANIELKSNDGYL